MSGGVATGRVQYQDKYECPADPRRPNNTLGAHSHPNGWTAGERRLCMNEHDSRCQFLSVTYELVNQRRRSIHFAELRYLAQKGNHSLGWRFRTEVHCDGIQAE